MKRVIIGVFLLIHSGEADCNIALDNGVNKSTCLEATECLKKDSSILKEHLSTLKEISVELSTQLDEAIQEYARCKNYEDMSKRKPNIKRLQRLAKSCTEYYVDLSNRLVNMNENFKVLDKKRKADLEYTLMATEASLEYVKKRCKK